MRRNSLECQIYRPVHALVIQSLIVPAADSRRSPVGVVPVALSELRSCRQAPQTALKRMLHLLSGRIPLGSLPTVHGFMTNLASCANCQCAAR